MRIALLSASDPLDVAGDEGATERRGFLRLTGHSIIHHQLGCALGLGCGKVICIAAGMTSELLAAQHAAEKAGVTFQIIAGPRALSGLVKANDELLVIADGLLPDRAAAATALADRPAVLAIPADEGIAAGYERIDREYAWAGLFMVRGQAVERLTELPPEADPVAGLLRIALQSGTRIVLLPKAVLANQAWTLIRTMPEALALEKLWLDRFAPPASFAAPSLALADRAATNLIIRGSPNIAGVNILACAAALGVLAGLAGWWLHPVAGFVVAAAAFFAARFGAAVKSIEQIGQVRPQGSPDYIQWLIGALDVVLIVLTAIANGAADRVSAVLAIITLLVLLRLGGNLSLEKWGIILKDRCLLALTLALSAYFTQIIFVLQVLAILVVVALWTNCRRARITQP